MAARLRERGKQAEGESDRFNDSKGNIFIERVGYIYRQ